MSIIVLLIPITLVMGAIGLGAFFWAMKANQFDDLEGDARRILQAEDRPRPPRHRSDREVAR
ncbi:cbb3-type cytochrome oxidase assembly protein CcoS [Paracoccus sp. SCSIO 75233]|uniref:cbb3-type cytochrome oxidase assembly protein CcoS n=1 Tax=Paracoccus sp. SCSIO 75233 TaxID=3017782 RepID=UPI0022F052E0|nr:cbb3-type cytochrome oxidase assembly protein CcoS [Paracoccus sp. SCSIO 75233]WBU55077.1 cbb3-type cytochrome oxidase assembly protein CcoS [Paracoccus sp. SCSIO 75233]